MSSTLLKYSMFDSVFMPKSQDQVKESQEFSLRQSLTFRPKLLSHIHDHSFVVFDFETTGLDAKYDDIIEIGAQKWKNGEVLDEISTLISCKKEISPEVQKITGISSEMLVGKPQIEPVLKQFIEFMKGSILIAHNAAFDYAFLSEACKKLSLDLNWPSYCTLKMAREFLPDLERKDLDTLAKHYGLQFESRHRSVGDVKVTVSVFEALLEENQDKLSTLSDLAPFSVSQSS